MLEARPPKGKRRLSPEEVSNFLIYGCKATLTSAGIHMQQTRGAGDSTTAIRH